MGGGPVFAWPWLFAQGGLVDPDTVRQLALRRWFDSLTLSSPLAAPSRMPWLIWLAGIGLALLLAVPFQGPRRALGQFADLPGHLRLLRQAVLRLRNAARTVAILLGAVVLAWTVSQFGHYAEEARLEDLYVFAASKSPGELAAEQGFLAALAPLRDLCGLGDVLLLLGLMAGLVLKLALDRFGGTDDPYAEIEDPLPRWTTQCALCAFCYAMYRSWSLMSGAGGLPGASCPFYVDIVLVPLLMALADGLVLGWVLAELRNAGLGDDAGAGLDVRGAVGLWPAAALACAAALPARYAAVGGFLFLQGLPGLAPAARPVLFPLLLGWGLAGLQGASLATTGIAGAAAWNGGRPGATLRGYGRMLRVEGGRLAGVIALLGLLGGAAAGAASMLVLSLPKQSWVLAAADSYAHYATLLVGLLGLSALVELGARSLPRAGLAATKAEAAVEVA